VSQAIHNLQKTQEKTERKKERKKNQNEFTTQTQNEKKKGLPQYVKGAVFFCLFVWAPAHLGDFSLHSFLGRKKKKKILQVGCKKFR
jgi:hypothetical protein